MPSPDRLESGYETAGAAYSVKKSTLDRLNTAGHLQEASAGQTSRQQRHSSTAVLGIGTRFLLIDRNMEVFLCISLCDEIRSRAVTGRFHR